MEKKIVTEEVARYMHEQEMVAIGIGIIKRLDTLIELTSKNKSFFGNPKKPTTEAERFIHQDKDELEAEQDD